MMTEEEWRSGSSRVDMVAWVESFGSERKLDCFGVACCDHIRVLLREPRSIEALCVIRNAIEGLATADELERTTWSVEGAAFRIAYDRSDDWEAREWLDELNTLSPLEIQRLVANASTLSLHDLLWRAAAFVDTVFHRPTITPKGVLALSFSGFEIQATEYLYDIFGNPFRPVAFSPAWRTSTAVGIALRMYDSRNFNAMPILADALQDAGCEDDAILSHCRDENGVHVRGCWVVDLVLGKK